MKKIKVLIVEDEQPIREMLSFALEDGDFLVREAATAEAALIEIDQERPDLVLLDWMLPDRSGIDVLRRIRSSSDLQNMPVIMLTARAEESDRVRGLEYGADDYVVKPFSTRELMARVHAVIRRAVPHATDKKIVCSGLEIDPVGHRVSVDGNLIEVGPTEFRLLHFLMANQDRVYSRTQLLDGVWGANVYVEERTVDVHIRRLRKALEGFGYDGYIQTVRGTGYRFSKVQ